MATKPLPTTPPNPHPVHPKSNWHNQYNFLSPPLLSLPQRSRSTLPPSPQYQRSRHMDGRRPTVNIKCDYLLNGVLSIVVLHLYLTRAPNDTSLFKVSRVYFDSCIKALQNAIDHLDRSNAEHAFLTRTKLLLLLQPLSRSTGRQSSTSL